MLRRCRRTGASRVSSAGEPEQAWRRTASMSSAASWLWQSSADWHAYPPAVCAQLDAARARGDDRVPLDGGRHVYHDRSTPGATSASGGRRAPPPPRFRSATLPSWPHAAILSAPRVSRSLTK